MKKDNIEIKSTPIFKLKDRDGRDYQVINLNKQFGFIPDVIIVQKVKGQNNKLVVGAVMNNDKSVKKLKKVKDGKSISKPNTK